MALEKEVAQNGRRVHCKECKRERGENLRISGEVRVGRKTRGRKRGSEVTIKACSEILRR